MNAIDGFDKAIVRGACEKVYGGTIDPHAWLRWKQWAGVSKGRTTKYTDEQFCMMIAIATLRSKNQYGELSQKALKKIAYSADTIEMVTALAAHVSAEGWALGWDIRSALALRGYEVSGAVLRRLMPKMRPNQWYQVDAVIRSLDDCEMAS